MRRPTDIDRLHEEIQELIDELWQVPRFAGGRRGFRPQVDCVRSDDPPALHVVVELPGVDPSELRVVAADRVLVVAGVRQRQPLEGRYQQMEIEYGPFQRRIPQESLSRVSSYDWFGSLLFNPLGLALAGPIAAAIGTSKTLAIAGCWFIFSSLLLAALPSVRAVRDE